MEAASSPNLGKLRLRSLSRAIEESQTGVAVEPDQHVPIVCRDPIDAVVCGGLLSNLLSLAVERNDFVAPILVGEQGRPLESIGCQRDHPFDVFYVISKSLLQSTLCVQRSQVAAGTDEIGNLP